MADRPLRFTGFTGGLYASANIFDQPRGTVPRLSNYVYTRRGGFRTVDGTHAIITPTNAGPYAPWVAIIRHNQEGMTGVPDESHLIPMSLDSGGTARLYNLAAGAIHWANADLLGSFPNAGPTIGAVQIGNSIAFGLGLDVPPQIYRNGVIAQIANTFQPDTNFPPWLGGTDFPLHSKIIGAIAGQSFIFIAKHGGHSGMMEPDWATKAPNFGDQVGDGSILWQNKGPVTAAAPVGAAFVFNHYNALWIWGTAATYLDNGIHGPDGLAMSTIGIAGAVQPTSFDPSNTVFVGQADGQQPMGGRVWSQLEVGIPAGPQLVLFKNKDTYSILGAFPAVQPALIPNGSGCAAPNTIQPVYGVGLMRLTLEGVAAFNGTRDVVDQYTDPIRPYLFVDPATPDIVPVDWDNIVNSSSVLVTNPPGYLLLVPLQGGTGSLTRGFFFDRLLKAWTVIDFPASLPLGCGYFDYATPAPNATLLGGWSDGIIRVGFSGDEFWDTEPTTPIAWGVRTPGVGAPLAPAYTRRCGFQGADLSSDGNVGLTGATLYETDLNGKVFNEGIALLTDARELTQNFDVDRTILGGSQMQFAGRGRVIAAGLTVTTAPQPDSRVPVFV